MTQFANTGVVFETDAAERALPREERARLKELRNAAYESGDWSTYNGAWHLVLREWSTRLPDRSIVFAHSLQDAEAVGRPIAYVLIEEGELARRQASIGDGSRLRLSALNRRAVIDAAKLHPLHTFDTVATALLYAAGVREKTQFTT